MKPENQQIAIAEACEWTNCASYTLASEKVPDGIRPDYANSAKFPLPDYLTDLNAMHEAEKVLTNEQWDDYAHYLSHITRWNPETNRPAIFHATAAQRAEAFCKTLNLWTNE